MKHFYHQKHADWDRTITKGYLTIPFYLKFKITVQLKKAWGQFFLAFFLQDLFTTSSKERKIFTVYFPNILGLGCCKYARSDHIIYK